MRIRWTLPAADDPEAIKNYLDIHFPQFSVSTIRKLYNGIRSLNPLPYIVTYRLIDVTVEILRIYHGAQNRMEHWVFGKAIAAQP